ncbi:hypothetical protein F6B41_04610 [Microbacterium lushaniae]|nr:hypothetical protein F6B41_25630 [Microbacterium lushaniae]KAA9157822.1 hypothetical protein F6B41_04610 [Microbacterium lushaniae]
MTKTAKKKISALAAASALALGFGAAGAAPASAAETASVDLADIAPIQSATNDVSFVDAYGETFEITVTTTWQRTSATQATLGSIVVRPKSMPRGDCLGFFDVGSTANIGFNQGGGTLCPDGYLTFAPSTAVTTYAGSTTLGQLTFRTPDPGDPFGGGAKTMVIEYAT